MNTFLVLKSDPAQREDALFKVAPDAPNSIEFAKTGTKFDFNKVFNNHTTSDVFNTTAKPLLDTCLLQNKDALMFTLGPTNSGKSHVLLKSEGSILSESLGHIFTQLEGQLTGDVSKVRKHISDVIDKTDASYSADSSASKAITISMFEIHKDKINDLLAETPSTQKVDLGIINDKADGKLRPHHMTRTLVNSHRSAQELVKRGLAKRSTAFTNVNAESSRSHCFIFIDLHNFYGTYRKTHRFTLADLAGLERSKTSKTTGETFREANYTNNSMTALGIALESHAIKQFNMSSLRSNKLTRLIMTDYIKSSTPVSLLVALDPFGEQGLVHQTLKYINPIRYQDLKKRATTPMSAGKITVHHGIISELTGYANEWKHKYKSSREESILAESKLRDELYKLNERKLQDLEILHRTETQRIKENFDSELNDKIDELNNLNNEKLVSLSAKLSTVTDESQALKSELEVVYREKLLLESNLDETKSQVAAKVDKLESEIQMANDKCVGYQEDIGILKLEIEDTKKEIAALKAQIDTKTQTIDKLSAQLTEKATFIEKLEGEKSTLEASIKNLNGKLDERDALAEELKVANAATLASLKAKEIELEALSGQIHASSETHSETIFKLEDDLKMQQFRVESLEDMKCKLEVQLKKSLDKHLAEVDALKAQLVVQENAFAKDTNASEEEERLISYERSIHQLGEELEGHRIAFEGLQTELEDVTLQKGKAIAESEEKLRQAQESRKINDTKIAAQVSQLESQLKTLEEEKQRSTKQNTQLSEELRSLKQLMEKQKTEYSLQLEKLTSELGERKSKEKSTRKSLVDANASLLDSDFAESFNIIKDVKSSPLKPAFEIHQDSPSSTPTRTKKASKRTKSDIAQSKMDYANGKTNKRYSATPSPKKTPLGKLNSSVLNRKEMQLDNNLMEKFQQKKRKSSSPVKSKSKLRKVDAAETSFDNLD